MRILAIFTLLLMVSPVFADLTGNATISPRYVDTFVVNQTFVYTITPTNGPLINRTIISVPPGYNATSVINVTVIGQSCTVGGTCVTAIEPGNITINFTTVLVNSTFSPIVVTFTANTSTSVTGNFTSYLNNSVFQNQTTDAGINVTTQQIINVTGLTMTKGTALLNGTDYWEFKFVLAFTVSQAGLIQFRMGNWTDVGGNILSLTNSTGGSHASLRNDSANFSTLGKFSVTNSYADNVGINRSSMPADSFLHLRMVIPTNAPPSNTWSSTYNFLFRATP